MVKKRLLTKLIMVLLLVTMLLPNICTVASATNVEVTSSSTYDVKGVVSVTRVNFREGPSLSSKVIKVLSYGTQVTILEEGEEWTKVEYEGQEGYLYSSYVDIVTAQGIITAATLNVRSQPTTDSEVIAHLYKGMKVSILERVVTTNEYNPVWYKVTFLDGQVGYISESYVKILTNADGTYLTSAVTTASFLNVRSDSNVFSKVKTMLRKGTWVIILETKQTDDYYKEWCKISCNGVEGWVASKYLQRYEWVLDATATTSSPSSGKNRNINMKLAGQALTGTIVLPGEKFSWLSTMGSCSSVKGYQTATVYINGKVSEGVGGGVCQVSTTFNMAVKKTGIETNANTHSLPVSYASRQDEASVSYPYLDFSFTNTLDTPILVEFVTNNGKITCNIYIAK